MSFSSISKLMTKSLSLRPSSAHLARSFASQSSKYGSFECTLCFFRVTLIEPFPLLRASITQYDRSGRSTGIAYISFETPAEASRAKTQLAGVMAKGNFVFHLDFGFCCAWIGDTDILSIHRAADDNLLRYRTSRAGKWRAPPLCQCT